MREAKTRKMEKRRISEENKKNKTAIAREKRKKNKEEKNG